MTNKIMVKDFVDGYYDVYVFNKEYKYEEVKKDIEDHIKNNLDEYTLETIGFMLMEKYDVKAQYYFDNLTSNSMMLDVNDICNNIYKEEQ